MGDSDTNGSWRTGNGPQGLCKEIEGIGNRKNNRDHQDHSIVKISLNAEESPEDPRRLVIQISVKDQLRLVRETLKEYNNSNATQLYT